jgi:hypothetical protein
VSQARAFSVSKIFIRLSQPSYLSKKNLSLTRSRGASYIRAKSCGALGRRRVARKNNFTDINAGDRYSSSKHKRK